MRCEILNLMNRGCHIIILDSYEKEGEAIVGMMLSGAVNEFGV